MITKVIREVKCKRIDDGHSKFGDYIELFDGRISFVKWDAVISEEARKGGQGTYWRPIKPASKPKLDSEPTHAWGFEHKKTGEIYPDVWKIRSAARHFTIKGYKVIPVTITKRVK